VGGARPRAGLCVRLPLGLTANRLADQACDDDTVQVTVKPPTIGTLIASVNALTAPSATKNSLPQKLNGANNDPAKGNTAGACDKLASFISQVKALPSKKIIPASAANDLIAEAEAVRASLGCGEELGAAYATPARAPSPAEMPRA
jgi:hypothetical protein